MRWFLTVTALALAVPAYAQENDAEKLFRQVEKKLAAAKSLQVTFDGELTSGGMVLISFKGKMVVGEGDKFSVDTDGTVFGAAERTLLVGNGDKVVEKNFVKA